MVDGSVAGDADSDSRGQLPRPDGDRGAFAVSEHGSRRSSATRSAGGTGMSSKQLGNVSQACKYQGTDWSDSFYRRTGIFMRRETLTVWASWRCRDDPAEAPNPKNGGITIALPRSNRRRCWNCLASPTAAAGRDPHPSHTSYSTPRPSRTRSRSSGCPLVLCQRHNLQNMKKRLKALEAKVAQEGDPHRMRSTGGARRTTVFRAM